MRSTMSPCQVSSSDGSVPPAQPLRKAGDERAAHHLRRLLVATPVVRSKQSSSRRGCTTRSDLLGCWKARTGQAGPVASSVDTRYSATTARCDALLISFAGSCKTEIRYVL